MAGQDDAQSALALETVGERLRAAREAAGLTRADIAARTKVAERHLGAIEEGRFDALASSTYAVGFARAYARTVGLEERAIAQAVREELAARDAGPARSLPDTFEPGDPARVPGVRIAWVAAAAAVIVVTLVLVTWRSYWFPAASLPDLTSQPAEAAQSAAPALAAPTVAPPIPGAASQPAALPSGAVIPAQSSAVVPMPAPRQRPAPSAERAAQPSPAPAATPSPAPQPSTAPAPEASGASVSE